MDCPTGKWFGEPGSECAAIENAEFYQAFRLPDIARTAFDVENGKQAVIAGERLS